MFNICLMLPPQSSGTTIPTLHRLVIVRTSLFSPLHHPRSAQRWRVVTNLRSLRGEQRKQRSAASFRGWRNKVQRARRASAQGNVWQLFPAVFPAASEHLYVTDFPRQGVYFNVQKAWVDLRSPYQDLRHQSNRQRQKQTSSPSEGRGERSHKATKKKTTTPPLEKRKACGCC